MWIGLIRPCSTNLSDVRYKTIEIKVVISRLPKLYLNYLIVEPHFHDPVQDCGIPNTTSVIAYGILCFKIIVNSIQMYQEQCTCGLWYGCQMVLWRCDGTWVFQANISYLWNLPAFWANKRINAVPLAAIITEFALNFQFFSWYVLDIFRYRKIFCTAWSILEIRFDDNFHSDIFLIILGKYIGMNVCRSK